MAFHRRVHHEVSMAYPLQNGRVDLALLRNCFAELMDRAAHLLQCDGLEQDDAEIERSFDCRIVGDDACNEVVVESLTDTVRFMKPIFERFDATRSGINPGDVQIVRLIARVVIDEGAPMSPEFPRP